MLRHTEEVAKKRVGIPGWEVFSFERVEGGILLEGGIPVEVTRGKNKGSRRWPGPNQKTVVLDEETKAQYRQYEAETGKCGDCFGEAKVLKRWHWVDGPTYKPCPKCDGTGKAS